MQTTRYDQGLIYRVAVAEHSDGDGWSVAVATSRWFFADALRTVRARRTEIAHVANFRQPLDAHVIGCRTWAVCSQFKTPTVIIDRRSRLSPDIFSAKGLRPVYRDRDAAAPPELQDPAAVLASAEASRRPAAWGEADLMPHEREEREARAFRAIF